MKIRQGFVSNSSSSSFVIFGKECGYGSEGEIYGLGKYVNEGQDFFKVTPEIRDLINKIPEEFQCEVLDQIRFYQVFQKIEESDTVSKKNLPEKFEVISFIKDNWSSDSAELFMENYLNGDVLKQMLKKQLFTK